VNDENGHPAGDEVLREIANVIQQGLRMVDVVGRYGGEEFLVVLPQTPHAEAMQAAERIRSDVAAHVFHADAVSLRLTISVGVATAPADASGTAAGVVHEADKALYRAKMAGRDRTA
jgi:diguanylate cyclase (GGDEF)-like protein